MYNKVTESKCQNMNGFLKSLKTALPFSYRLLHFQGKEDLLKRSIGSIIINCNDIKIMQLGAMALYKCGCSLDHKF